MQIKSKISFEVIDKSTIHPNYKSYTLKKEMSSSYTWCNSTRVTPFLSHRFSKDLTVKKKTSSFFTSLNAYLINSILIISLLIKYFFVSFFFFSTFYALSFFFLPSIKPLSLSSYFLARYSSGAANRSFFTLYVLLFSFSFWVHTECGFIISSIHLKKVARECGFTTAFRFI